MKKIALILLIIIGITACSSDEGYNYHYETLPVATYKVPDTFEVGKTYEIKMKYLRPSNCYKYAGIYFDKNLSTRTIAVDNLVIQDPNCTTKVADSVNASFPFLVVSKEPYTFKFYKGEDSDGKNIYDEVVIPVK